MFDTMIFDSDDSWNNVFLKNNQAQTNCYKYLTDILFKTVLKTVKRLERPDIIRKGITD